MRQCCRVVSPGWPIALDGRKEGPGGGFGTPKVHWIFLRSFLGSPPFISHFFLVRQTSFPRSSSLTGIWMTSWRTAVRSHITRGIELGDGSPKAIIFFLISPFYCGLIQRLPILSDAHRCLQILIIFLHTLYTRPKDSPALSKTPLWHPTFPVPMAMNPTLDPSPTKVPLPRLPSAQWRCHRYYGSKFNGGRPFVFSSFFCL